jgi:hypothetical protein
MWRKSGWVSPVDGRRWWQEELKAERGWLKWSRRSRRKNEEKKTLISYSHSCSRNFPHFMKPEISLPFSQEPKNSILRVLNSVYLLTLYFLRFILILSLNLWNYFVFKCLYYCSLRWFLWMTDNQTNCFFILVCILKNCAYIPTSKVRNQIITLHLLIDHDVH